MKMENFELIKVEKVDSVLDRYFAEVDVTTGIFRKKKERKVVCRETCGFWYWQETGKFTPAYEVEALARAYTSKTGKEC